MAGLTRITDLPAASTLTGDELLELSQASTTVTITASTISAAASDNSYNDSGSGFIAAGFIVGDRVRVTGFTGNVANNIVVGTITALTTAKMTIGGTDGDVIVDEAAGESVIISKWTSKRVSVSSLSSEGPYDIRISFGETPIADEIIDTIPIVREISFPANFSGSVGIIGANPTSTLVLDVKDDGTTIGTISISTTGVFTFATVGGTAKVVAAGSFLTIVAPATPDATAANMQVTFSGAL